MTNVIALTEELCPCGQTLDVVRSCHTVCNECEPHQPIRDTQIANHTARHKRFTFEDRGGMACDVQSTDYTRRW